MRADYRIEARKPAIVNRNHSHYDLRALHACVRDIGRILALVGVAGLASCGGDAPRSPSPPAASPATPGLSAVAALGEQLFRDESLSVSGKLACRTCHRPDFAHAAPPADVVSQGGPGMNIPGIRNSPSIRYASFTPAFGYDAGGAAFGGFFRDGRAASLVEQAKMPFTDPREMANAAPADVIARLRQSPNAAGFRAVYGAQALDDTAAAFDGLAAAIAQYEVENPDFHRFDSKYDAWLAGKAGLAPAERRGLELFEDPDKGNCVACHPSRRGKDGSPPLFTDYTYDNVGVPRNAGIAANADPAFFDLGLCGPERRDLSARRDLCGAFKVPTLRNVARTAPYFHNGAIESLREVVAFYARRDTDPGEWYPKGAAGIARFDDLPPALAGTVNTGEVPYDRKPGEQPALTPAEIDDIVAFLKTLDDGYN
jgi:cytochrome c peroxidase